MKVLYIVTKTARVVMLAQRNRGMGGKENNTIIYMKNRSRNILEVAGRGLKY